MKTLFPPVSLWLAATIVLTVHATGAFAQAPRFSTHRDFSSGYGPASIAVGDVNGDAQQDLVSANNQDHTLGVLLGAADGTFARPRFVYLGPDASPRSVAIADFDGDTLPDVAVASSGHNTLAILSGNGDGTFQPARTSSAGGSPVSLAAADFNRDARPDIAIVTAGSNGVSVLLGNGDGTFQAARSFAADAGAAFVAAGDLNGDARPDLAVANTVAGTVSVLLANGDGTFEAARNAAAGPGTWSVTVGDIDNDGTPDLAAANNGGNTVSVLIGNGDGTFEGARDFPAGPGPTSVAVGDFNGDTRADLAVANERDGTPSGSNTVSILTRRADDSFDAPRAFAVGTASWSIAAGRFNADSALDLAVANTFSTTISVLLGNGDGTFPAGLKLPTGLNPEGLETADFNGDGNADLVVANAGSSTVSVFLGNGDGRFQAPLTFPSGPEPVFVAVGDFNGDGHADAVVANYGASHYYSDAVASTVSVLLGNGDGSLQPALAFEGGSGPHGISVADFNRDGVQDLAVANLGPYPQRATTAAVLPGLGDGTFGAPQLYDAGLALTGIAAGDFNGDGAPDLALSSGDDATVAVLVNNGNGTFGPKVSYAAGSSPKSVSVGQFNLDRCADLAVTNHWSDTVSVLLGNCDGTFQPQRTYETGRNPAWVAVRDLNGDGLHDLAVADWFSTTVTLLTGKGDGTFQTGAALGAAAAPEKVVVSDFNGDGQPDLAVANYFAASVSVILNGSATQRAAAPTFTPPGGTYSDAQSVTLGTTTSNATIRYTTDGSTPTSASPVYSGPIPVTRTTTIRAIATATGMIDSDVSTATYTLQAAAPTFNPPGGNYLVPQFVEISSASAGAAIYYTTDGSTPTTSSARYTGPILVASTTTIRAIALASGWSPSTVASATYTILLLP